MIKDPIVKTCPICGSKRIRRVHRDVQSVYRGQMFIAKRIHIEECPTCGERLSRRALEAIASQHPPLNGKRLQQLA